MSGPDIQPSCPYLVLVSNGDLSDLLVICQGFLVIVVKWSETLDLAIWLRKPGALAVVLQAVQHVLQHPNSQVVLVKSFMWEKMHFLGNIHNSLQSL